LTGKKDVEEIEKRFRSRGIHGQVNKKTTELKRDDSKGKFWGKKFYKSHVPTDQPPRGDYLPGRKKGNENPSPEKKKCSL